MQFKNSFRYITLLLCVLLSYTKATSQAFSYIYIQGDKQTPFYVKLEDQMQPRYGKNYCIISQLAPGSINIEILFQQNIFPSQKFIIKVPDNSYRGFLLTHKGNAFSLYDIQQQFYLPAGNTIEDDHMPENVAGNNYLATNKPTTENITPPITTNTKKPVNKKLPKNNKPTQNKDPQFIENIELNNEKTVQNQTPAAEHTNDTIGNNNTTHNKPAVNNSDCPKPVGSSLFGDIYNKAEKHGGKTKLKFLLSKLDYCFTSGQVRILTKMLDNDQERYEFLKQVYPRVTDQSNFSQLESLLSTQEWKNYFHSIIQ